MKRVLLILILLLTLSVTPLPVQAENVGSWLTCTVDNASTTSDPLDLGDNFEFINLCVPTITTGTITIYVCDDIGGTFRQLGSSGVGISSTSGLFYTTIQTTHYRFIKIVCGATQVSGAVTFKVRGYN